MATHGVSSWGSETSVDTMRDAIQVAHYLVPHALEAFDRMGADPEVDDARRVLRWIIAKGIEEFAARDAFEGLKGQFKKMPRFNAALHVLVEHQYLQSVAEAPREGPGRPPSPRFIVNPRVHSQ